jgi:hypothetical protein
VGSWCIGLLQTERAVTGQTSQRTCSQASSATRKQGKLLVLSSPHSHTHPYISALHDLSEHLCFPLYGPMFAST